MNNATNVLAAFREMTANKAISRDELNDLIKDGILAALAKRYGPNVEAEIEIDENTGAINITVLKEVVAEVEDASRQTSLEEARWDDPDFEVGDVMEVPVEFAQFGRNAVMAAKQRILQRVREGERQKIRDEYEHRVGELLSGEVQQVERGKLVVLLNRAREADAIVPWKEQNPRERFRQGETIRAVLKKVEETPKGPRLILSRADPLFVAALFKLEVPEINQGIVDIRAVSREVGGRTKLAVSSRDESIDPVGACVGLKGSRVRAVVQELGGERIDIVPWHPDPEIFAKRALAPARVAKVISDYEARTMTAIVDEDQLSLAIGRNGQNVRLASQLIGWQLDLYGSREWLEHGAERALFGGGDEGEFESADFPLNELDLPPATLAALQAAGYNTFYDIIDLDRDDLLRIPAIGQGDAERIAQLIEEMTVEEEAEGAVAPAEGAEASAEDASDGAGAKASAQADTEVQDEEGEGEGLTREGAAENLASSD
ncbi:MAG TPA: transcription termination factor NusA [Longimicrobium sp.]|jgi:N utilization substance protein A|nr:transcription termination factor NusA [Longimicrobium sp.]